MKGIGNHHDTKMPPRRWLITLASVLAASVLAASSLARATDGSAPAPPPSPGAETMLDPRGIEQAWTGDFDGMFERRMIRIAVPYSRTLYYVDKGREFGLGAEVIRDFERWINRKYAGKLDHRPLTVFAVVTPRDEILASVAAGRADIGTGNLTVTNDRQRIVDFVAPMIIPPNVEVLITGPASPTIGSIDALAGQVVHVRRSSSYHDSLVALNQRLRAAGRAEARIVLVPDDLEDEDMMEMLDSGLLNLIVVDEWKAKIWAPVLPSVRIRSDIVLRPAGSVGWAVRKDSPNLVAELNDAYRKAVGKDEPVEYRNFQAMERVKALRSAAAANDRARFESLLEHFEKYGRMFGFDPLMLAAQGYQESGLDQSKRSPAGAIGIMQLLPTTGAELGVGDITLAEPNIHAGAKYLDSILRTHFTDADLNPQNRVLFAVAGYNAGPKAIETMRTEARKRGLDPNIWFNNVEVMTGEKIGLETTTYVRNIYKYYVSYRLTAEAQAAAAKLRDGPKAKGK